MPTGLLGVISIGREYQESEFFVTNFQIVIFLNKHKVAISAVSMNAFMFHRCIGLESIFGYSRTVATIKQFHSIFLILKAFFILACMYTI